MARQQEVTTARPAQLPAEQTELDKMMQEDAGAGVSNLASDNLVPQIKILQPLSPEVLDGPDKVEGAKPGDFLVAGRPVKEIWFQPCHQDQTWLEFTPLERGGGFVAQHPFRGIDQDGMAIPPSGTTAMPKMRHVFASTGNEAIHYRQMAGIAWADGQGFEYVIPFKSTGHTVARQWMTKIGRSRLADGKQRPIWSNVYRLSTSQRRNASGQWYVVEVGDAILLSSPDASSIVGDPAKAYSMGKALNQAFKDKTKAAAVEEKVQGDADPEVM